LRRSIKMVQQFQVATERQGGRTEVGMGTVTAQKGVDRFFITHLRNVRAIALLATSGKAW